MHPELEIPLKIVNVHRLFFKELQKP